jgi:hypothetical protein
MNNLIKDLMTYNRSSYSSNELKEFNNRVPFTNSQKMAIFARYLSTNFTHIKINDKMIILNQLKVGDYVFNKAPKSTITYCLDFDLFNRLCLYKRKWYKGNYVYQNLGKVYLLRGSRND